MGVTRQYIYKLVKESKLRASRLSGKKSLIRRADIELMMKTKPYERIMPKEDFDITEYYTAEEIAQKYKVNAKWVWTYTRQHKVPKVRIRQFNYYRLCHLPRLCMAGDRRQEPAERGKAPCADRAHRTPLSRCGRLCGMETACREHDLLQDGRV